MPPAGSAMIKAALIGNAALIPELHQKYPNIAPRDLLWALYCAASKGHANCIAALGENFPTIDSNASPANNLPSPLDIAVKNGHANCINALHQYYPETCPHARQGACLTTALKNKNVACIRALCTCWPNIVTNDHLTVALDDSASMAAIVATVPRLKSLLINSKGQTLLMIAASKTPAAIAIVHKFFPQIDVNALDHDNFNALFMALINKDDTDCVTALKRHYPKINFEATVHNLSMLKWAEVSQKMDAYRLIYQSCPNFVPTRRDIWFNAAICGDIPKMKTFKKSWPSLDVDMTNEGGLTACSLAAAQGHDEYIKALHKAYPNLTLIPVPKVIKENDPELTTLFSNCPFAVAARFRQPSALALIISLSPDVHPAFTTLAWTSALIGAVQSDCAKAIVVLRGALTCFPPMMIDIDEISNDGDNHLLLITTNPMTIDFLASCWPAIDGNARRQRDGMTPLSNIIIQDAPHCISILQRRFSGLNPNAYDNQGKTALMHAMHSIQWAATIRQLGYSFGTKLNPNIKDNTGDTPLHVAVSLSMPGMISTLRKSFPSIDPNLTDKNKRTPLIRAVLEWTWTDSCIEELFQSFPKMNVSACCSQNRSALMHAVSRTSYSGALTLLLTCILKYVK